MLTFDRIKLFSASLGDESSIPLLHSFYETIQTPETNLDEDDELYIGYGFVNSAFPYRARDKYDRDVKLREFPCAILENKYLKATFLPSLGGRLWSLIDKLENKELLFTNPVIQPGYLAVRNAWFSGGIEWNCGVWGHTPLTCEPMFTARLRDENGNDVLRMYEFERIRNIVYQMDFILPEDSPFLCCRMRIENCNTEVKPMYWWSNIAVPEIKGARVIVPADESYTHDDEIFTKKPVPYRDGIDFTYPTNQISSYDNFWKIAKDKRKYICQLDENGYGLFQSSTSRLRGRKLFVWGQKQGGSRWQSFLSGKGSSGRYCEIQAGLASTQHECLPMPPKTAWEWMEFYGPMHADPAKVHGPWSEARQEVEKCLNDKITEPVQEEMLVSLKKTAKTPASEVIYRGSGWGMLENDRRKKNNQLQLPKHLDFSVPDMAQAQQLQWYYLMENNKFPAFSENDTPPSWMLQDEWIDMIAKATENADKDNWYAFLQLGVSKYGQKQYKEALEIVTKSLSLKKTIWGLYVLGETNRMLGDTDKYAELLLEAATKACQEKLYDESIIKAAAQALYKAKKFDELYDFSNILPVDLQKLPRIKLYKAFACVYTGRYMEAEAIILDEGGLIIPDIKEGEVSLSELWYAIQEAKAKAEGKEFERTTAIVPEIFDFRMK